MALTLATLARPAVGVPEPRAPVQQPTPHTDAWFGEDKLKHAFASLALVGFAHAGARVATLDGTPAVTFAVSAATATGLWKEWRDRRTGTSFSARDLVWDALGIGVGALLVAQTRE
jgi:uncharacterized protein YfiM (DUF2279 family)